MIAFLLVLYFIALFVISVTGKISFKRKMIIFSVTIIISWAFAAIALTRDMEFTFGALFGFPIIFLLITIGAKQEEKAQKNAAIRERQQVIALERAKEKERERRRQLKREARREVLGIDDEERRERIPQNVQDKVWIRDGGRCVFCGSNKDLEFDHIIPFSKGGANTYRNIQLLCQKCNREKSDRIG